MNRLKIINYFLRAFLLMVYVLSNSLLAQKAEQSPFSNREGILKSLGDSVLHGSSDSVREKANKSFQNFLECTLNDKQSVHFVFNLIKTLGTVDAPDNTFRIYSWIVPKCDGSEYAYYGFVQTYDKKTSEIKIFPLTDSSKTLVNPQMLKLKSDNWYGALYYKILKNKKGGKAYYTLLGWHGKNQNTTQKIIDVVYFNSGKPVFGYPLFKTEKVYKDRIIFEYTTQAVMSLKYEEGKKMIVFDHLSPPSKEGENMFSIYGPDGSYDAFRFKGGHWLYMKDIDMRTDWQPKKQSKKPQVHEAPIQEMK